MSSPKTPFSVGEDVRVAGGGKNSRRGTISYHNESDDSYDVLIGKEEEITISSDLLSPIFPFETQSFEEIGGADVVKDCGNQLFQVNDYDTAYSYYIRAHKMIQQRLSSTFGQRLIISLPAERGRKEENANKSAMKSSHSSSQKQRNGKYVAVTVTDVREDGLVDVMFDEEVNGIDEEEGVPSNRVLLLLSGEAGEKELQRSLLMNLAKCSLKLTRRIAGWACFWSYLALAFIQGEKENYSDEDVFKRSCDVHFVLAKSLLAASRPGRARKAAQQVEQFDRKKAKKLYQEIDVYTRQLQKQNKHLAKNIAEWVDKAMTINANMKELGDSVDMIDEDSDLPLDDVEGKDDGEYKSVEEEVVRQNSNSSETIESPDITERDDCQCIIA